MICVKVSPIYPSPGEQNFPFTFTLNFLIVSILSSLGEEVKEKNGKTPDARLYARVSHPNVMHFRM